MDPLVRHRQHPRRGNYSILMGITALVVIGFAALAVDVSLITMAELQAQATADAASHAALVAFRQNLSTDEGNRAAAFIVEKNKVAMGVATIESIRYGEWDFDSPLPSFDASDENRNAVEVTLSRQGTNAVDLLLAPILGMLTHDVDAVSVTAQQKRSIMLIQDMSCSMMTGIPNDTNSAVHISMLANREFLRFLQERPQVGDKLGLAMFSQVAANPPIAGAHPWGGNGDIPWLPLQAVPPITDVNSLTLQRIEGICDTGVAGPNNLGPPGPLGDNCLITGRPSPHVNTTNPNSVCRTNPALCAFPQADLGSCTNPAEALRQARLQLSDAADDGDFRGIVLMSDGLPNCNVGNTLFGQAGIADAIARANDEANLAAGDGISIWTILFHNGTFDPEFMGCGADGNGDGLPDNPGLTRGIGFCQSSPDAADLPNMYRKVAESLPTAFVQ